MKFTQVKLKLMFIITKDILQSILLSFVLNLCTTLIHVKFVAIATTPFLNQVTEVE